MSIKVALLSGLAAALASCASAPHADSGLQLTATAVEVVPSTDPAQIAEVLATATDLATKRQILVSAVVRGPEIIQFPKIVVLEDQRATLFVGELDGEGVEDGLRIDLIVKGETAMLEACKLDHGRVVSRAEIVVPVESAE